MTNCCLASTPNLQNKSLLLKNKKMVHATYDIHIV